MGIFDKIKKFFQRVIPGGKTGREVAGPVPTAGTDRQVAEQRAAPREAPKDESPAEAIERVSGGDRDDSRLGEEIVPQEIMVPFKQTIDGVETTIMVTESQKEFLEGAPQGMDSTISPITGDPSQPTFARQPETIKSLQRFLIAQAAITPLLGGAPAGFGKVNSNTKTLKEVGKLLKKFFGKKALLFYGAWAGSVGVGLYAQSEAVESISINMGKYLIPEAERTGDWSAVNDAMEAAKEITDISVWEKILFASPVAVFPGALNKLKGNAIGVTILDKYTQDQQVKQELGQTEEAYWKQRDEDRAEEDRAVIDFYNDERKKQLIWEREASEEGRNEDAAFWRKEREKQRKLEAEDREAIAVFWLEYKKEAQRIADNSRPSQLNFGGLF